MDTLTLSPVNPATAGRTGRTALGSKASDWLIVVSAKGNWLNLAGLYHYFLTAGRTVHG